MGRTVLIVDDHVVFRSLARSLLTADGWIVVGEAGDGDAALSAVRELDPDVVLLDIQLPGRSGVEVARELEGDARASVVLVSSREATDYGHVLDGVPSRGFLCKRDLSAGALDRLLL